MATTPEEVGAKEEKYVKFDEQRRDEALLKAIGLLVKRMRIKKKRKQASFTASASTIARIEKGEISTPALVTAILEMIPCGRDLRHYFKIIIKGLYIECDHCRPGCAYDKTREETLKEVCGEDLTDDHEP